MKNSKKQYVNQLIHNFKERIKSKLKWYNILAYLLSAILGILFMIIVFTAIDIQPATYSDFKELEQQAMGINELSDLININSKAYISDDIVTVEFPNEECSITVEYTKDFKILSVDKFDKSHHILFALLMSFACFFVIFNLFGEFFSYLVLFCSKVLKFVYAIFKKLFLKIFKRN